MEKRKRKSELLLDLGSGISVCRVSVDNLREQDLNARYMPPEMMKQLSANIGNRGVLESLPFCAETKKGIEIVSGHHRIRAARSANVTEIYILLDQSGLTQDQIVAKQLAHNSIGGVDDPQILKELFKMIHDVEARIESFIDPKNLDVSGYDPVKIGDIETDIQFKQISFLFLAHQLEAFDDAANEINKDTEMVGIADLKQYEQIKEAIHRVREIEDIRAVGMILSRMSEIVQEYYDEQEDTGTMGSAEE